jgi:hypothetical protein
METSNMTAQVQEIESVNDLSVLEISKRYPASLGKLNRTAANAMKLILGQGHGNKRFKRDYENGVSTYVCPHCSAAALVMAVQGRGKSTMEGSALDTPCSNINLQK